MNKEQIYDTQINPLMAQIIKICTKHKIATFATFAIPNNDDPGLSCTTHLPDETGELPQHMEECKAIVCRQPRLSPVQLKAVHADGSMTITRFIA